MVERVAERLPMLRHRLGGVPTTLAKTLSHDADSQIPATHLEGEATELGCIKYAGQGRTFGFNGSLYSGSISVGVKVHGRHHGGERGFMGLRIQNK